MLIVRHYQHCPDHTKGAVVAIGNFDGVHQGHQAVIKQAKLVAQELSLPLAILTFEPHPQRVISPDAAPLRITAPAEKLRLLHEYGADIIYALHFNKQLAGLSAYDFIHNVLVNALNVRHVVVGYDFIFGNKRSGNIAYLQQQAALLGIGVTQVQAKEVSEIVCSSSTIRSFLQEGKITNANQLLGRSFKMSGKVHEGAKLARSFGVPTANIRPKLPVLLRLGVYIVEVPLLEDGKTTIYQGVANLGNRPTVDGLTTLLEVHLFGFEGNLYGKRLSVLFHHFLRPEQRFDSIDALVSQIQQDIKTAKETLKGK